MRTGRISRDLLWLTHWPVSTTGSALIGRLSNIWGRTRKSTVLWRCLILMILSLLMMCMDMRRVMVYCRSLQRAWSNIFQRMLYSAETEAMSLAFSCRIARQWRLSLFLRSLQKKPGIFIVKVKRIHLPFHWAMRSILFWLMNVQSLCVVRTWHFMRWKCVGRTAAWHIVRVSK